MASPSRNKAALRYLESINDDTPVRVPLQPSQKYNARKDEDLDALAKQLSITPTSASPSKTALLRTRFESPSVTVSSFKTPSSKSSSSSRSGSPGKGPTKFDDAKTPSKTNTGRLEKRPDLTANNCDDSPSWANANYKNALSPAKDQGLAPTNYKTPSRNNNFLTPLKQNIDTPSPSRPFLQSPSNSTSKDSPGYEYLCRIQAIKTWLEEVLEERIDQEPVQLISYIRNGILLAKLANVILPTRRNVFLNDSKLQFRHTENINRFFGLLDYMNVPDLFRFELTDLYDAKNVPKVWFCLHAMTYMLNKSQSGYPRLESCVGTAEFSEDDIRTANRSLVGSGLPNFSSADTGSSNDSTYMNKMVGDSPQKSFARQPQPEPVQQREVAREAPKVFFESAIQTDEINPFRVALNTESSRSSVGTSTVSSRLFEAVAPSYTFDEEEFTSARTSPKQSYDLAGIDDHTANIIKLQSLSRGAIFRYKMFVNKIMLKSFSDELSYFICIVRGNLSRRRTVHKHRDELLWYKHEVVQLQSLIRSKLAKRNTTIIINDSDSSNLVKFQSLLRAHRVRNHVNETRFALFGQTSQITELQSIIRRNRIYLYSHVVLPHLDLIENSTIEFQAICRGCLAKKSSRSIGQLNENHYIIDFQSIIRGNHVRNSVTEKRIAVVANLVSLKELQSIARGGLSRSKLCNNVLLTLLYEDQILNQLYAKVRGNNVRRSIQVKKFALEHYESRCIVPIQSIFRGVLQRFKKEIILDDLYTQIDQLIEFQAILRGTRTRYKYREMIIYYHYNIDQVIKAQAILRSRFTQQAYRSLISSKNPNLATISRFAYLLTDNDKDYQEELDLSDLKNQIIENSKINEDLENQIENLDVKLSLLDKNKITIEDFIKNKKKVSPQQGHKSQNLERLNKTSRARIEYYQTMFYFLQTKPVYFVRLYKALADHKLENIEKDLQSFILSIFPISDTSVKEHAREEYFFVKFILELMKNDAEQNCHLLSDLTKSQSCYWIDFFLSINNHTFQRQHLKGVVGPVISHIIENDELNFESDPCEIYKELAALELKVNGFTTKDITDITPQAAIKDSQVSNQFIQNLMNLRELSTDFLNLLNNSVDKIPLHVRVVCSEAYRVSKLQFPHKTDQQHLAVAGVIFIKHYISSVLQYPENYGYLIKDPFNPTIVNSLRCGQNLKSLSRTLLQLFSLKPFSDNFLKPLNDYVTGSIDTTKSIIVRLINVDSIDKEYGMNDYNDIINHNRPKLSMNVSKMIQIEKFVSDKIDILAPSSDDQLFMVISKLNETLNSIDDYVTLTDFGNLTLNLNPTTKEDSLADSKYRSLITQVKRCILYIIRIQEGENLLELLISGITKDHETKFANMVHSEKKEVENSTINGKKRPYYRTSLGDLSLITYHELKKMTLNLIIQLETMGYVTRNNSYQDILNQIAVDIKTKDSQRSSRKSQLDISMKTIEKLIDKQKFLKKQLVDYNNHIETILAQLQSKPKDKKIFNIIPVFSKQYFYHRELRKRNRLPKFGSYKYSAKKLVDQDIIIDFGGLGFGSSSKLDLMFSCHKVGHFVIEAANGSVNIPGAFNNISLDQLLNYQYENTEKIKMFDDMVVFDAKNLIAFIFKKFYDIH